MSLGTCRHCEYEPVASGAKRCPRCGGFDPNPSAAFSVIKAGLLAIAVLIVAAFCAVALFFGKAVGLF